MSKKAWYGINVEHLTLYNAESKNITWDKRTSSHLLKSCFATGKKNHCTTPDPCSEASMSFCIETRQSQEWRHQSYCFLITS